MSSFWGYLVANIILLVLGQYVWKVGMQTIGAFSFIGIITSFYIWGGLVLYGIATILWLKVISMAPLSLVYPIQSIAYVLGIIIAYLFLGESVPITRWIGGVVIMIGVGLIAH